MRVKSHGVQKESEIVDVRVKEIRKLSIVDLSTCECKYYKTEVIVDVYRVNKLFIYFFL